ncbi:PKD-like domain-containing protein [Haliscomenobacter hydrossis]|nr:PKD-like domain-containing protein [Haliscomenobacter hydrossis]
MYAQSLTYNSSGTFIVPTGVTSITVQSWGAGGGGASGSSANRGGGGGGAFATSTFAVVPGASYTVTVGTGGAPGVNGGNSSFGIVVIAVGGSAAPGGLVGGAGGQAAACTPALAPNAFSGGNGGGSVAAGGDDAGGGGGGAASSTANGGHGAAGTSSTPGAGGQFGGNGNVGAGTGQPGDGGNGADDSFAADAQNGFAPGGGGGGMSESLLSDSGDGANGRVVVSWACGLDVSNFSVAVTEPVCEDGPATVVLSSNTVPDGTYSVVYSVSGANTSSNNNATVTFTGGTGSFTTGNLNNDGNTTITINSLGCANPSNNTDSFVVDDGPAQPGAITGGTSVCDNVPGLMYSIAAVPGATSYTWTVPVGWQITAGQGTTSITVTSGALFQGGVVSVVANNTCGSGVPRVLGVLPNANNIGFFVTLLNEVTLCEDEVDNPLILLTDNLEGGDPTGSQTFAWQVSTTSPAGPFVAGADAGEADDQVYNNVLDDYNTPGVYYFRRIITNNAYCGTADISMVITLNIDSEIESFSYDPDTVVYCANTAITPLAPTITGGVGATFTISPALPAGLSFDAATGTISGTPTTASPATNYTVVATTDCNSLTTVINITVAAAPVVTITGPVNSCEGDGSTLTVVVTATGGTAPYALAFGYTRIFIGENCDTLDNGPTGNAISQTGVFQISFTGFPAGTYNFGGTVIDANGCSGTDDNVEFTIYAEPVGEALTKTIYSCNRVNVNLQNQIDCNLPSTFSWYSVASVGSSVAYNNPNVDGETINPTDTVDIFDLLTNTTTVNQTIIYRVVPTSVAGGCVGEPFYITVIVLPPTEPACLSCMGEVNVSLDANCKFTVLPNHVIDFDRCENGQVLRDALEVVISGTKGSNIITCAGTYTYVVRLKPEYVRCFVFSPCWGKITAEDKTAPELICAPADVTLDCYDVNYVLNERRTIGNVGAPNSPRPAANATDGRTINNAEGIPGLAFGDNCQLGLIPPALVPDNIKNLGYAYYKDNCRDCGCRVTLKWTDKVIFYSCTDPQFVQNGYYAKIEREWVATDCNGMRADAYIQNIYFTRPDLDDFVFSIGGPADRPVTGQTGVAAGTPGYDWVVEYQSCTPDKSLILHDDVTPYDTSYFHTSSNYRLIYLDKLECNYSVSIKDTEFPICGGKGVKIDRALYVFDWCAGKIVDTFHILIKIGDFKAPTATYEHHAPYVISTGPMDCTAAFPITAAGIKSAFGVEIKDNCTLTNISVSVYTKDRYVKGILVYEGPDSPYAAEEDEDNCLIQWEKVDYAIMNGNMIGVPVGRHVMKIEAFDGCYNSSTLCFEFEVKDKIAPVMKCDDDLHISLSNANGYVDGYAQVTAADIDEGSWDNCKLAWIAVRRNVPTSCTASFIQKGYDSNGNGKIDAAPFDDPKDAPANWKWIVDGKEVVDGIDNNGDGDIFDRGEFFATKGGKIMTPLQDAVDFFCCDLAERVTIELWGADTADNPATTSVDESNWNYCWNDVLIEDKVAPTCVAPWDITVDCDEKNLAIIEDKVASAAVFGDVSITTGSDCANLDTVYTVTKNLKCGYGKIVRSWALTKRNG